MCMKWFPFFLLWNTLKCKFHFNHKLNITKWNKLYLDFTSNMKTHEICQVVGPKILFLFFFHFFLVNVSPSNAVERWWTAFCDMVNCKLNVCMRQTYLHFIVFRFFFFYGCQIQGSVSVWVHVLNSNHFMQNEWMKKKNEQQKLVNILKISKSDQIDMNMLSNTYARYNERNQHFNRWKNVYKGIYLTRYLTWQSKDKISKRFRVFFFYLMKRLNWTSQIFLSFKR